MASGPLEPEWLAGAHDRLAAGQFDEAVAAARRFLREPAPVGGDLERHGAALYAAAVLIGMAEGQGGDTVLSGANWSVPPATRQSVAAIVQLCRLLEVTSPDLVARLIGPVGDEAITALEAAGQRLATEAAGYQWGQPIRSSVWFDGHSITRLGARLSVLFRAAGDLRREVRALFMRAKLTTHVLGQYDHEVIPAMIDVADCLVRYGRADEGLRYYEAVFADYARLPDEHPGPVADPMARVALEALAEAARRYPTLVPTDPHNCPALLSRIEEVLARPVPGTPGAEKADT
jgi:hypothetical protein